MNEIVKTTSNEVANIGGIGRGFEKVNLEKVIMPRVKLMQALSPELQDEDYDFKAGDFIHGLLMEKLPSKFIPISAWDAQTLFKPREEGGGILCRSLDGNIGIDAITGESKPCNSCPMAQWHGETPPQCTQSINVLALFEGYDLPVVITFANTSYKYGRRFRDMALFSGGDIFSRKYKLVSKQERNPKGVFYTMRVKPAGKPTEEELALAEKLYNRFAKVTIEVEQEPDDVEETEAAF